jgi:hypothetical protein
MKKCGIIVAAMLLLSGCSAQETLETISDMYFQSVMAEVRQVIVDVPKDAGVEVLQSDDGGKLYLCDGYTVTVQTMEAGDLNKTLLDVTGYAKEDLTMMQTRQDGVKRYECIWTAAGESETQVGRACVLDDGNFHYVITVMAGESVSGGLKQVWKDLFDSFRLVDADVDLNTGS